MIRADINKRRIGLNFSADDNAEIVVWAPEAETVELLLTGSQMRSPLQREDYGYWSTISDTLKEGSGYKFMINGEKELPDPASLYQPNGVHGSSSAIRIDTFPWADDQWKNLPLEEYIIYELHTGTFTEEGTFAAIEEKLDYLLELGITAIEIMPVAQFAGEHNWGYDGVYPFAVHNAYGGAKDLQHLVDACHQKGMAVILDVVYNHLGPEGNYLGAYGPYFTTKYNTPWGGAVNFDDAWCDGVRSYFIENALMWFRDFHIDALRLDAVHAIKDLSPVHILRDIKEHVDELMKSTGKTHYLIVESDLNDNRFINPLQQQGYGMDAQWIDEFHHALRVAATGEKSGYYSDFTGIKDLAKAFGDAYVFDGQYSEHRKKFFGIKAESNDGKQFIVFSQNHDQVGNRMLGERTSLLVSFEMQKLMAGAVLVSPYLPMLFMGEEWSEPNPFLYFVSHTDHDLAEAVRKGRKEEFAAFHAQGEAPDPLDDNTFLRSKLQWNLATEGQHATMLDYYKTFIALRKQHPALAPLFRKNLQVEYSEDNKTIILQRWTEGQRVVILMNFSTTVQQLALPGEGSYTKLLDSADENWLGKSVAPIDTTSSVTVPVQPESLIIYAQ